MYTHTDIFCARIPYTCIQYRICTILRAPEYLCRIYRITKRRARQYRLIWKQPSYIYTHRHILYIYFIRMHTMSYIHRFYVHFNIQAESTDERRDAQDSNGVNGNSPHIHTRTQILYTYI